MNRTELAKKVNLKDEDVKALFDTIVSTVASGEEVSIHGFEIGRASCRERV